MAVLIMCLVSIPSGIHFIMLLCFEAQCFKDINSTGNEIVGIMIPKPLKNSGNLFFVDGKII